MEYTTILFVLLISVPNGVFRTAFGIQQKFINDLRRFKVEGVVGRFAVNRDALEQVLQNRKQQDAVCGHDVNLQLPQNLPHSSYNISSQGEAMFMYGNITDERLAGELSNDLLGQVATSYRYFDADIPVVIGNGRHGVLALHVFTDSTEKVLYPYYTSVRGITQVDSIEEEDDGTVTIRLNDDVMVFQVQDEVKCDTVKNIGPKIGKDFDKVMSKVITTTSYPSIFDWGCDLFSSNLSFCEILNDVKCELAAVEGDVCTLTSTTSSKRCPTTFRFVKMTGIFQEMFPFLAETVPSESFEAEFVEREHTTGITYPCLTLPPT